MNMRTMKLTAVALWSLAALALPGQAGTLDDYYLQQFGETPAAALKSVSVSTTGPQEVRCGMPLKHDLRRDWNSLQPATQKTLAKQLAAPVLANEALLPSAHFVIHYATTGADAPTPAFPYNVATWVQQMADSFEFAYTTYTGQGYRAPPAPPYHIYLRSLAAQSIYGQTTTSTAAPSTGFPNAYSSYIEIDKDFTNSIYTKSPPNPSPLFTPLESLQITSAHEFHHAIQYGYSFFFDVWYAEATSTWNEAVLYPSIGQNYGYVPAWFKFLNSTKRLNLAVDANAVSTGAGYGRWIFNRYLAELHNASIVRTFWENLAPLPSPDGVNDIPMLPVIDATLGGGLPTDFLNFARRVYRQQEWSLAADRNSRHLNYIPVSPAYSTYPVNISSTPQPKAVLEQFSFVYYKFVPTSNLPGLTIFVNGTPAIVARVFRKDSLGNITDELAVSNAYPSSVSIPNAGTASEIVLLLVNTSGNTTQNANFSTDGSLQNPDPVTATSQPPTTTASSGGGGGGGGGGCFIATAAYGSYLHPQVQVLRDFRDTWLLTNTAGRAFVTLYYRLSPPVADVIARHPSLRLLVRLLLTPLVAAIAHPAAAGALLLAGAAYLVGRVRRKRLTAVAHPSPAL